jgi:glycerophosphoryl diester phosphodiesterase
LSRSNDNGGKQALKTRKLVSTREPATRPIAFAHRGGLHRIDGSGLLAESVRSNGHVPQNSIEAFRRALAAGCEALEADIWPTSDGKAVVYHDAMVRTGLIFKPSWLAHSGEFGSDVPTLEELYEECGFDYELSLDCRVRGAGDLAIQAARDAGGAAALSRLWLCSMMPHDLLHWKRLAPEVTTVDSGIVSWPPPVVAARMHLVARLGVEAFNMHISRWTKGLADLGRELGMVVLGWGVNNENDLDKAIELDLDGIYSDEIQLLHDFVESKN